MRLSLFLSLCVRVFLCKLRFPFVSRERWRERKTAGERGREGVSPREENRKNERSATDAGSSFTFFRFFFLPFLPWHIDLGGLLPPSLFSFLLSRVKKPQPMRVRGSSGSSSSTGTKTSGGRTSFDRGIAAASSSSSLLVFQGCNGHGGEARKSSEGRALVERFVVVVSRPLCTCRSFACAARRAMGREERSVDANEEKLLALNVRRVKSSSSLSQSISSRPALTHSHSLSLNRISIMYVISACEPGTEGSWLRAGQRPRRRHLRWR